MKTFTKMCLIIALISILLGFGLMIVAGVRGFSFRKGPVYSMEDTVKNVRGLDISIDYGDVIITSGDEFSIQADNIHSNDQLRSEVINGVWVINHEAVESYKLFGFKIPVSIGFKDINTPKIRITLPEGFIAEDMKISLDAGRLRGKGLHSKTASLTVDAGSMEIEGLVVESESSYTVGAGQINLKKVDIRDVEAECDVGAIFMEGSIGGDNVFRCDVGSIKLDLDNNMDKFSFDIDSDLGNVIINNKRYHSFNNTKDRNDYKGSFRLFVNIGNITMSFSEY